MDLDELIGKPVDLKQLVAKLDFTDEAVEAAALEHPRLFLRAARYRVQKMRDRVEAGLAYETRIAKLSAKLQSKKDEKGKRTMTEGAVKARVQLDSKIHKLRRKMEMSFVYEKFAELLVETYRKREFAIKVIIDARWAEAGKVLKVVKEEGAKNISRKMMNEVRDRYKKVRHGGGSSESNSL